MLFDRARRFLARTPAAIAGQHGDLHTFRVCCRLVRGFALSDDEACRSYANGTRDVRLHGRIGSCSRRCATPGGTVGSHSAVWLLEMRVPTQPMRKLARLNATMSQCLLTLRQWLLY